MVLFAALSEDGKISLLKFENRNIYKHTIDINNIKCIYLKDDILFAVSNNTIIYMYQIIDYNDLNLINENNVNYNIFDINCYKPKNKLIIAGFNGIEDLDLITDVKSRVLTTENVVASIKISDNNNYLLFQTFNSINLYEITDEYTLKLKNEISDINSKYITFSPNFRIDEDGYQLDKYARYIVIKEYMKPNIYVIYFNKDMSIRFKALLQGTSTNVDFLNGNQILVYGNLNKLICWDIEFNEVVYRFEFNSIILLIKIIGNIICVYLENKNIIFIDYELKEIILEYNNGEKLKNLI